MNRKLLIVLLFAVLILLAAGAGLLGLEGSLGLLCLPLVLAAKGLRWLSLSGGAGNAAAIVLLLTLCCLPLLLKGRGKWKAEDALLVLSCGALLYCMYYLINPSLRPTILSGTGGQLALCAGAYSLLLSWAILRLLRGTAAMEAGWFYQALQIFLLLLAAECLVTVVFCFSGLPEQFRQLRQGNTMPGLNLTPTYILLVLTRLATALEYALDALVLFLAAKLVKLLRQDPYGAESCDASQGMILWCRRSLAIIVLSNTAVQLLQLVLAGSLHSLSVSFRVPVMSLAIVFSLLALASLLHKGRQLQEDSELFI